MSEHYRFMVSERTERIEAQWALIPNLAAVVFLIGFLFLSPIEIMRQALLISFLFSVMIVMLGCIAAVLSIAGLRFRYRQGFGYDATRDRMIRKYSRRVSIFLVCALLFASFLFAQRFVGSMEAATFYVVVFSILMCLGYPFFRLVFVPIVVRGVLVIVAWRRGAHLLDAIDILRGE